MAQDYGQLQWRIADEIGQRGDLLSPSSFAAGTATITLAQSPIQNAIQTAIAKWERVRFYFNELTFDAAGTGTQGTNNNPWFTTVAGQEFYGLAATATIASIAHIDKLHVLISGNRYFMEGRTWQYLTDVSINATNRGQPVDYAYANEQLRFYPIPDGAYPVGAYGTKRLTALSANSDSNAWTTDAEALIRAEAKTDLFENVLQTGELADRQRNLIAGYLRDLRAETTRRSATNMVRPSYF